jgi:exopolyphosphatase/guanosine-5'-triphosphate,3'-diphosphate pyrophosphatase
LREGRLFGSLSRAVQDVDPLIAAAAKLGRATARDPELGGAMITFSDDVLGEETPSLTRLRHAVCHVADSGWREHPETRAREAFLRLIQYPFVGLDHPARVTLALAVFTRYEGNRDDPVLRRPLQLVGNEQQGWARALGQLLDLGLRVCGGVPAIAATCRLRRNGNALELRATHPAIVLNDEAIRGRLRTLAQTLGYARSMIAA